VGCSTTLSTGEAGHGSNSEITASHEASSLIKVHKFLKQPVGRLDPLSRAFQFSLW